MRRGLDLRELGLRTSAAPHGAKRDEADRTEGEDADQDSAARARLFAPAAAAARRDTAVLLRVGDPVDEVEQRRCDAVAAMRVEGLRSEPAGGTGLQDTLAAGPEVPADDNGVRSRTSDTVVELLQDPVWIAARLLLGRERKDGDIDRACTCCVDLLSEPGLVGGADRELGTGVDVHRIALECRHRSVDPGAGLRSRRQRERRGSSGRDQQTPSHGLRACRARRRAP